jgi:hypothetical protein
MAPHKPVTEMACATCRIPLNTLGDTYIHPIASRPPDHHPVVPVPVTKVDTVHRTCDFCSGSYPVWTLVGGDVTAVATSGSGGLVQNFGDRWATCAPCYQHIVHHRSDRLVNRALRTLPPLDRAAEAKIAELHHAFLAGLRPGRTLITTTAWPVAAPTAHALPRIRDRLTHFYRGPIDLPDHLTIDRASIADRLERGRLYWADPTFTDLAVTAAQNLPTTELHPDLIPGDNGLLAWATPIGATIAVTWTRLDATISLVRYRSIGAGLDEQVLQTLREDVGWLAPIAAYSLAFGAEINPGDHTDAAVVLATWLLMGQPATESAVAEIDKTTRKRYERAKRSLPDVRLVRVRGASSNPAGTSQWENLSERATAAARVWVTGHWRNQPYGPGRALRRPVYIHPFLRGPEDAPIKLSTTVRILPSAEQDEAASD